MNDIHAFSARGGMDRAWSFYNLGRMLSQWHGAGYESGQRHRQLSGILR